MRRWTLGRIDGHGQAPGSAPLHDTNAPAPTLALSAAPMSSSDQPLLPPHAPVRRAPGMLPAASAAPPSSTSSPKGPTRATKRSSPPSSSPKKKKQKEDPGQLKLREFIGDK